MISKHTSAKATLVLIFLLILNLAEGQPVVVLAYPKYTTYLMTAPAGDPLFPDQSKIKHKINNNSFIVCFGKIDTNYNGQKITWFAAVEKNNFGYVHGNSIMYTSEEGSKVALLPYADLSMANLAKPFWFERKSLDSLRLVNEWKKKEELRKSDSLIKDRLRKNDSAAIATVAKNMFREGVGILRFDFTETVYGGVDFEVMIANYSKKTIKYIWLTVTAYNAVEDSIGTKTVQLVGPVKSEGAGGNTFKNVFYTNVFDYGKIKSIKVQYMDGTTKIITGENRLLSITYPATFSQKYSK